ncbi:MAG: hypothetical protein ACI8QT_001386 [Halioglobus sp.]|jgi:hypothetical protein
MTKARKIFTLAFICIALGLLYPGVTQPVLTLSGTIEKAELAQLGIEMIAGDDADTQAKQVLTMFSSFLGLDQIEGKVQAYSSTRSMWGTVEELARSGNVPVALLIVFFSLVIPVFKLLLQLASLFISADASRKPVLWLNAVLSKWSMSDVFVMGLLVAFMAGRASDQVGDLLTMNAALEPGFYYFLAYCLFSIAASIIMQGKSQAITNV